MKNKVKTPVTAKKLGMPVILVFGRLKGEDYEFKASLGYETLYQKSSKEKKQITTIGEGEGKA